MASSTEIRATPFQEQVLALPSEVDLVLAGGRGGGKSYCVALETLRRCERWPGKTRTLVLRTSAVALNEFAQTLSAVFAARYGRNGYRHNAQLGTFTSPAGDFVQLGYCDTHADLLRWQGQSFDLVVWEEGGQLADLALLDLMLGSLRTPHAEIPCRVIVCANPGGRAHSAIVRRWLKGRQPWRPYQDDASARIFVVCPSTLDQNPHLGPAYARQLGAVQRVDPGLYEAWRYGNWDAVAGEYFAGCWHPEQSILAPLDTLPRYVARTRLGVDWGSAKPAYCSLAFKVGSAGVRLPLRDGREQVIAPDSWVLFDEVCTATPDSLNVGTDLPAEEFGWEILDKCNAYGMRPRGVLDCANFTAASQDSRSVAQLIARAGVHLVRAKKGRRVPRLARIKQLMADAGDPQRPGVYVTDDCTYWLETVPNLARSPRNAEDADTNGPDHALDALSYLVEGEVGAVHQYGWRNGVVDARVNRGGDAYVLGNEPSGSRGVRLEPAPPDMGGRKRGRSWRSVGRAA